MNLSKTFARIQLGAYVTPPENNGDVRGNTFIGRDLKLAFPQAETIWAGTIFFGAAGQAVALDPVDNLLTPGTAGTRQVESASIAAGSGCTAAGTMTLTVTAASVTGSPLAIGVPLTPAAHPTAAAIATAAAAALNANAALAERWTFEGVGNGIVATQIYPSGNDGTFNIAIPVGLGVTAAASSANTTAGVLGSVIERVGGNGNDIYGYQLNETVLARAIFIATPPTSLATLASGNFGDILPGTKILRLAEGTSAITSDTFTASGGPGWMDVILIGEG